MKQKWALQVKEWEEGLRYSDPEKIEVKKLLTSVDFKNKKVLDVGCGIARLTLPISKMAKEVVAIDQDKKIIDYCKKNKKRTNITYLVKDIKKFKEHNFDIVVFAQPDYDNFKEKLKVIASLLNSKGQLIIIRWIDKGNQYNRLLGYFWNNNKKLSEDAKVFSKDFIKNLSKLFKIKQTSLIETYDSYPSKEKLAENIIRDSPIKFNKKEIAKLHNLLPPYNYKKVNIKMKMYICELK